MIPFEKIKAFYLRHLANARVKGNLLSGPCPFCASRKKDTPGTLVVQINPDSHFAGYFRCLAHCVPGGFHFHFARLAAIDPDRVPGYDPDDEGCALTAQYPARHLQADIDQYASLMSGEPENYFKDFGISRQTLKEMKIGFNGRYLVYPYHQENELVYSARCLLPGRADDFFWHGNPEFSVQPFAVFNAPEIHRCEGGCLMITHGELNALILKELGYPAIAVPAAADLTVIGPERLDRIRCVFLLVNQSAQARLAARELAVRLGFKARILKWPAPVKTGAHLSSLAADPSVDTAKTVALMISQSRSFSPFASGEKERQQLADFLERQKSKPLMGIETGFGKLDQALEGLRGITILGGPPKAGKSCFFMQISTEIARRGVPVIYYDFENGRQKIYLRTLVRLSKVTEKQIRQGGLPLERSQALQTAWKQLDAVLTRFRVVTDRQLTPQTMKRHIEFIKHETRSDDLLIVVDSLHKLPFKKLTERRKGIDSWLRQLEAIRDEHNACFLVISELTRGKGGGYGEKPDLSSFKESGDIEYSADNAMVLMPEWDPMSPDPAGRRQCALWVVASRESAPGQVARYMLNYPFWEFVELHSAQGDHAAPN
jgi:replicative DNA helicase